MLETLFTGIFEKMGGQIGVWQFVLCVAASLLIGIFLAGTYARNSKSSQSFHITLALLPAIVCVVIMMVNGNVGAGVAVAGAFSLVRFRSVPGTAKEIGMLFLAMGVGLITGMGYLGYAALFAVLLMGAMVGLENLKFGKVKGSTEKILRITVPEDLNYGDMFDDLFEKYTDKCEVLSAKTSNMGSLFKLNYNLTLKDQTKEKEFIDALRCRNGNLEISISRQEVTNNEL